MWLYSVINTLGCQLLGALVIQMHCQDGVSSEREGNRELRAVPSLGLPPRPTPTAPSQTRSFDLNRHLRRLSLTDLVSAFVGLGRFGRRTDQGFPVRLQAFFSNDMIVLHSERQGVDQESGSGEHEVRFSFLSLQMACNGIGCEVKKEHSVGRNKSKRREQKRAWVETMKER